MNPQLFHIFGSFSVHAYRLLIALGVISVFSLTVKDKSLLTKYKSEDILHILSSVILAVFCGARLLWAAEVWQQLPTLWHLFYFWQPGYSVLGGIIGGALYLLTHLKKDILFFLDRFAIYIPLGQVFGRIGCFFTGCCYGVQTTVPWAVIYKHHNNLAPLNIPVHPTQLYSAFLLFCLFTLLYNLRNKALPKGSFAFIYLLGTSLERFLVDFLRADRTLIVSNLSFMQCVALGLIGFSFTMLAVTKKIYEQNKSF